MALVANRSVIVPRFHPCVGYLVQRATVRAGGNSRREARAAAFPKFIPSGQYARPTPLIPIECQRSPNDPAPRRSLENIDGSGYEVVDEFGSTDNAIIGDLFDALPEFVDW